MLFVTYFVFLVLEGHHHTSIIATWSTIIQKTGSSLSDILKRAMSFGVRSVCASGWEFMQEESIYWTIYQMSTGISSLIKLISFRSIPVFLGCWEFSWVCSLSSVPIPLMTAGGKVASNGGHWSTIREVWRWSGTGC